MRLFPLSLLLLLALPLFAQSQSPADLPQYLISAGAEYGYYSSPKAAGFISFGARISSSNVFSYSTVEMAAAGATIRSGAAYLLKQTGNWNLFALGDGGLLTGGSATLGAFGLGPLVTYRINRITPNLYAVIAVRVVKISSTAVQPILQIGIAKGF